MKFQIEVLLKEVKQGQSLIGMETEIGGKKKEHHTHEKKSYLISSQVTKLFRGMDIDLYEKYYQQTEGRKKA